ncbi:MAG TPA: hypothetical protein VIJ79_03930 [Acidobacteriaceae bacterium]
MFDHVYAAFNSSSVFTTPDVPGRVIEASFGMVGIYSATSGITSDGITKVFTKAADELLSESIALGGNAVVAASLATSMGAFVLLGTAVRLSNPTS